MNDMVRDWVDENPFLTALLVSVVTILFIIGMFLISPSVGLIALCSMLGVGLLTLVIYLLIT